MDEHEFESYVKAGEIARAVKDFAREIVKKGVKLIDIAEAIDERILELGGEIAFPVNLSLNEIAAHFTPAPSCEIVAEGLLKVDLGVAVDGYIADTAFSVDLTDDKRFADMIELNEKILGEISKNVKVGMETREVGKVVQDMFEKWSSKDVSGDSNFEKNAKFSIIRSLSGHSLRQNNIHAGLTISNYRNDNRTKLDEMAFAIEPFVTSGVGDIYEGEVGGIYVLQSDMNVRDKEARKVLEFIKENYKTRPFCLRWLEKEGFTRLRFILGNMVKTGILYEYPMLIEKSRKPVSQVENTFLIGNGKVVCTTG